MSNKEILVEMSANFGRQGNLEGLFVVSLADFELAQKVNPQVYFGEVLGKHSEIYCDFNYMNFSVKTDDPAKIAVIKEFGVSISGYNPFD